MTRIFRGGRSHAPVSNGCQPSGDIPPSTVAAQIVNNLSKQEKTRSDTEDAELFEQLLSEVLGPEGYSTDGCAIEPHPATIFNIICVIKEAGLEKFRHADPFSDGRHLLNKGLRSLSVLQLAVQTAPDVLFITPDGCLHNGSLQMPLFPSLMAKMLALLGLSHLEGLQLKVVEVLVTILTSAVRSQSSSTNVKQILNHLKSCITAVVCSLEDLSRAHSHFQADLPTKEFLQGISKHVNSEGASPKAFQLSLNDTGRACVVMLQLASVLAITAEKGPFVISLLHIRLLLPWALDCFSVLPEIFEYHGSEFKGASSPGKVTMLMLRVTRLILRALPRKKKNTAVLFKAINLLAQFSAWTLKLCSEEHDSYLQAELTKALMLILQVIDQIDFSVPVITSCLLPAILLFVKNEAPTLLINKDFQLVISLFIDRYVLDSLSLQNPKILALRQASEGEYVADSDMRRQLLQLQMTGKEAVDVELARPKKKRRFAIETRVAHSHNYENDLLKVIYNILESRAAADLTELNGLIEAYFERLNHIDQCKLLRYIGCLPCVATGTASVEYTEEGRIEKINCLHCDSDDVLQSATLVWNEKQSTEVFLTLQKLLKSGKLEAQDQVRVWTMITIRKLLRHSVDNDYLDLSTSMFGQWCLQCICSSLRELRLAAGKALIPFLTRGSDLELMRANRVVAIQFLDKVSQEPDLSIQETCVRALAHVAYVSTDEALNIVLHRLVSYLGHTNQFIHGVAYDELARVARSKSVSPRRLFSPFWRSIAVSVVKDINARPQTAQLLCDLLGIPVNEFLTLTQSYTLPYLVLYRKQDVIQRIAHARGPGTTAFSMLSEDINISSILALLLIQTTNDVEDTALALLQTAAPEFNEVNFTEVVRMEPILTAYELFKAVADGEANQRAKLQRAIALLAVHAPRGASQQKTPKRSEALGLFFENHVLGIVTQFSDTINGPGERQPVSEKKRCLRGMEEMTKLAKQHISSALPQIRACLQSALDVDELREEVFSAWATMMEILEEEDVGSMLEITFSLLVQKWSSFQTKTQTRAHAMMTKLITKHSELIKETSSMLPSLSSIPLLSPIEERLGAMKAGLDTRQTFQSFSYRCQHENGSVVAQALTELLPYLRQNQAFLHLSAVSEQPDSVVATLIRSLLDCCIKLAVHRPDVADLCGQCIGIVGCLDPNRVEAVREHRDILVVDNFERAEETSNWIVFFLQEVLIKAFKSATHPRSQGFLAYAMQELLEFCGFKAAVTFRSRESQSNADYRRWIALPEDVRNSLTPFLTSQYVVGTNFAVPKCRYPIFPSQPSYGIWLRTFVLDLLQSGNGENAQKIFPVCFRIIKGQDIAIANFLLPFVALNVAIGGEEKQAKDIGQELLEVLKYELDHDSHQEREDLKLASEAVFHVLDYFSKWLQEKRKQVANLRHHGLPNSGRPVHDRQQIDNLHIQRVEQAIRTIPAAVISRRAVECKSYARALFHWEQHIRQMRKNPSTPGDDTSMNSMLEHLQDIYTQIDEPDGIEGISAHLHVLNIDQQILEHRKAGRWTAAQSWYELQLSEKPDDTDVKANLLTCLKESGQYDALLNYFECSHQSRDDTTRLLPFVAEASWVAGKWATFERCLGGTIEPFSGDFNVNLGQALLALHKEEYDQFTAVVRRLRAGIARGLSGPNTASLQACHENLLRLHVLSEVEAISGVLPTPMDHKTVLDTLDRRLTILGPFLQDKQYILGVRRATMKLSKLSFTQEEVASAWLTSARLARKGRFLQQSFDAVMHALKLGSMSATIEHSRLLWAQGQHRKAIQGLEGAIAANAFKSQDISVEESVTTAAGPHEREQNLLMARAYLLLAKWLDSAGQTQSQSIISKYQEASRTYPRWEKGFYYLGRHYNKLYESEKSLPPAKQSRSFMNGETARLVIHNYTRSLSWGAKYIFQTVPRFLTLWLDLGAQVNGPVDPKHGLSQEIRAEIFTQRQENLEQIHNSIIRYVEKGPAFVLYTALAQLVARLCHPNETVYGILQRLILKVVSTHPQQALWTLLAVAKSSATNRKTKGISCLAKVTDYHKKAKVSTAGLELKTLINQGQKLSGQLLNVCEGEIHGRPSTVSLGKDLGFNHKTAPCLLAVPLEATLTASLPTVPNTMKTHKAFARDVVTISSFLDDVLVLNSLQRPRKISVRGSDGRVYGLLCKPKDDLRKDQRLMEFNAMINRSLKRDGESSKRRLYIRTYAVTPLNEECGLIEWIDNLKPLRDIVVKLYKSKGVAPNYSEIRSLIDEAQNDQKDSVFTERVLPSFPPVFHEWFVEMFPEPGAWFNARLNYTRSCAVMSMVGMVLGLGDRHGENILFEEGNGGTMHVDFNCLFDKGLTFEKPEMVPFRLTHNMVDAFGVYGFEGPFRKSCELTLQVLRQHEDTLLTILETFVYDPTTDFIGKKKRKVANVPETPQDVLDSVRGKVKGLLPGETVALSVEGQVQELVLQATSARNLASMYIGWCAFF